MKTEKKKRGRPPKHKAMEFEGIPTREQSITHLTKRSEPTLTSALPTRTRASLPTMNAST